MSCVQSNRRCEVGRPLEYVLPFCSSSFYRRELAGHRNPLNRDSTRSSPSRKKSTAAGAPTFPAATSSTEGSRTTRRFFPLASATRSASSEARTDGWISARARGRPYSTTMHREGEGPLKSAAGSGPRARAVAISIEDRRTDKWKRQAASLGGDRTRYLAGKRLSQYSRDELGKFQIITDVYGGFSYTEDLSRFVGKVLSLLEVGGSFYTLMPGVHLESAKDKLGILYLTELEDAAGRPLESVLLAEADRLRASYLRVEEQLEKTHRAVKYSEGLQRRCGPAPETMGVRGGISALAALPIRTVG